MALFRTSAVITFVLTAAYYVLRVQATRCTGLQCDNYVGPSLLFPILIVVLAGVSGLMALAAASAVWRQGSWVSILAVATLLSILGPIVSAVVFRNNPDILVPLATVLALLAPLGALIYSFLALPASK
jgi:hypothetical protein